MFGSSGCSEWGAGRSVTPPVRPLVPARPPAAHDEGERARAKVPLRHDRNRATGSLHHGARLDPRRDRREGHRDGLAPSLRGGRSDSCWGSAANRRSATACDPCAPRSDWRPPRLEGADHPGQARLDVLDGQDRHLVQGQQGGAVEDGAAYTQAVLEGSPRRQGTLRAAPRRAGITPPRSPRCRAGRPARPGARLGRCRGRCPS